MPGVIDTNILLYGVNADAPEHQAARKFLFDVGATADTWYLTDGILYEFLRVATHHKVFPKPLGWQEALDFLQPLLDAPNIALLQSGPSHASILRDVLDALTHPSGNLFFDVRTVVLMREHGVRRIYTTDTDFLQFAAIDAVNPLRA